MDLIEQIRQEAKKFFDTNTGHEWDHVERVTQLALHIGKKENADLEVIEIASILHDIGRMFEIPEIEPRICHAEKGAELAKEILEKYNFNQEKINQIIHCIETHRYRNTKIPESKEARILFDADKLDSIGAVGIGRAFYFAHEIKAKLHNPGIDPESVKEYSEDDTAFREFAIKLKNVRDKIFTQEGKRLAEGRHNFMIEFFNRLDKEVIGEL